MTKSERLMHVIEMMRRPEGISVEELRKTFNVSERTVFRDLSFLAELNVPVYFDGSYHVAEKFSMRSAGLDYVDIELLLHAVSCSPLMEYPALAERCHEIMSILRRQQPPSARREFGRLLSGQERGPVKGKEDDSRIMRIFLDAVSRRRLVKIALSRGNRGRLQLPVGIRLENNKPVLLVTGKSGRSVRTIALDSVRAIEETETRFSRRPIDLLKK